MANIETVAQLIEVLSGMPQNLKVQVGMVAHQTYHNVSGAHVVATRGIVAICATGEARLVKPAKGEVRRG